MKSKKLTSYKHLCEVIEDVIIFFFNSGFILCIPILFTNHHTQIVRPNLLGVLNSHFQENKNVECYSDAYDKQMRFLHMTIGMSKI